MRWGQVKVILIAVLLVVNLVMFSLLVSDYQRENYIDATFVEQAVPLLAARGLTVEPESIPRQKCALTTRRLTPAGPGMTAFLRALLGERGEAAQVTEYENRRGRYQMGDDLSFSVTFARGYPETFGYIGEVADFLERAAGGVFELVPETVDRAGDRRVVRFRETVRGLPVEDCYVDATLEGGALLELSGRLALDERMGSPAQNTTSAVDALFDLADYLEGTPVTVRSVQAVLSVYRNPWGTYNASPVYLIKSRAGLVYRVNASGEVSVG